MRKTVFMVAARHWLAIGALMLLLFLAGCAEIEEWIEQITGTTESQISIPSPPTNIRASDETYNDKITVSWNSSSGATSYEVYRATSSGGSYSFQGTVTGESWTDTGLGSSVTYYYKIKACSSAGCSDFSSYDEGSTGEGIPDPPKNVQATDEVYADAIAVSWDASSGATSYKVYRATSSSGSYYLQDTVTGTSWTNTGLWSDVAYYYKIKACNSMGCSDFSSSDEGSTGEGIPDPPTHVAATDGVYADRIAVSWNSSSGAADYKVYRATSAYGTYYYQDTVVTTSWSDTDLSEDMHCWYKIEACNSAGCSDMSAYDEGFALPSLPPPTNVRASDGSYTDKIIVSWSSSDRATFCKVYRATSAYGTYYYQDTVYGTSWSDTGLGEGVHYWYKVEDCNSSECSDKSSYDEGFTTRTLDPPTNVQASDGTYTDKITVSWNSSSGATSYKVYRATSSGGTYYFQETVTGLSWTNTGLGSDVTYYYKIKACNSEGCSGYSSYNQGSTGEEIPDPPTDVQASDGTYTDKITVSWNSSSGATSYNVYRATSSGGTYYFQETVTGLSWTNSGLASDVTYYYKIKACNSEGCSGYSSYSQGSTDSCSAPSAPSWIEATDNEFSDRIEVRWEAQSVASYYKLYRARYDIGNYELIAQTPGTFYNDFDVECVYSYDYKVRACNDCGCGSYSSLDDGYTSVTYMADVTLNRDYQTLALEYMPVLVHEPGTRYYPIRVDFDDNFDDMDNLATYDASSSYQQQRWVYIHIRRSTTTVFIEYWYYYVHNPFWWPFVASPHTRDWELAIVVLNNEGAPQQLRLGGHGPVRETAWTNVDVDHATHPFCYAYAASHAMYWEPVKDMTWFFLYALEEHWADGTPTYSPWEAFVNVAQYSFVSGSGYNTRIMTANGDVKDNNLPDAYEATLFDGSGNEIGSKTYTAPWRRPIWTNPTCDGYGDDCSP